MKIHAHFYTNDEEVQIFAMHDLTAIPFKVGDEIHLDVDELYPADYNKFREDVRVKVIENADEHRKLFDRKTAKIVRRAYYARFNNHKEGVMTLEYHCEIIEPRMHGTEV